LHCTSLATVRGSTLGGNEGGGGEHILLKVHGSWLGYSSGNVLTNCWRDIGHSFPCQPLLNIFINMAPLSTKPQGIYHIVTAESTFHTVLIVVPGYTICPHIQSSNIGRGYRTFSFYSLS
jgi:hypothetical protein